MANDKFLKLLNRIKTDKQRGIKATEAVLKSKNDFSDIENTVLYAELISVYSLAKNYARVINLYEQYGKMKITGEFSNSIDIFCSVGIAYAKNKDFKRANVLLEKYLTLLALYKDNKYSFSDEAFRKPIFTGDNEIAALRILIVVYSEMGRSDDALRTYFQLKRIIKPEWDETMLTIGMIVKNESKVLEKCLKALSNLRKNVKCELIIVDTGSDDNTVEIAKKYADEVRFFAWNGDFSAARNESLRDAKGDWFMYLDADEIFENTDDIEKFFNSAEHIKYNFGSYVIRNYFADESYSEFPAPRMTRLFEETAFSGTIHEALNMYPPAFYFKSFAHHHGYAGTNLQKKNSRNITNLLHEYAKNPSDVRVIFHLAEAYIAVELNAGLHYILMGFDLVKDKEQSVYNAVYRAEICYLYQRLYMIEKAYEFAKECSVVYEKNKLEFCVLADIYAIYGLVAAKLKHYEEAIKAFERYCYFYEAIKSEKLSTIDLMIHPPIYVQSASRQLVMNVFCFSYTKIGDYVNAKIIADSMDKPEKRFGKLNFDYVSFRLKIMRNLSDYSGLSKLVKNILTSDVGEDIRYHLYKSLTVEVSLVRESGTDCGPLISMIKDIIETSEKGSFPRGFVDLFNCLDLFINEGTENITRVSKVLESVEKMTVLNADIIPLLMTEDFNIDIMSDRLTYDFIENAAVGIIIFEDDLLSVVSKYSKKIDVSLLSARGQLLLLNICGYLLKSYNENSKYSPDDITNLYVALTANYLETVYKSEIISEENVEHMSKSVQIGFYLFLAAIGLSDGERLAHAKNLRKLIAVEPLLKEYVSYEIKKAV
ncbi:MAG: glycosyltransferase [Ruminococcus sp.]|jgi:glycosyltransferase involved in cell wall biosynthesis|nr:glycosyltransferase [Ruminococcus sp.]